MEKNYIKNPAIFELFCCQYPLINYPGVQIRIDAQYKNKDGSRKGFFKIQYKLINLD